MSANLQTHTAESQSGVLESGKKTNGFIRWAKLLLKSKTGTVGFIIVLFVCIVAAFANYLALHDPAINPAKMLKPPSWMEGGEKEHLLGTDNLGRDMLSRIIYGSESLLARWHCIRHPCRYYRHYRRSCFRLLWRMVGHDSYENR